MGGVGQEFVQSELSRSDQGPPRALLEIRRKAGLRNERCMPLLQMLDQLGRPRLARRPTCSKKMLLMERICRDALERQPWSRIRQQFDSRFVNLAVVRAKGTPGMT